MKRIFALAVTLLLAAGIASAAEDIDAVIDFEGLLAGAIVSHVNGDSPGGPVGPVVVWGSNPEMPGLNACVIFDSDNPTGADKVDWDLGTPNEDFGGPGVGVGGQAGATFENNGFQHNLLIIDETLTDDDGDGLVDHPDDADLSDNFLFDFSTISAPFAPDDITVFSLTLIDVEADEPNATIRLYDALDNLLEEVVTPSLGDNGVARILTGESGVGVSGVAYMLVNLGGSGAIDDIEFQVHRNDLGGEGCTPGYWKQSQHFGSWVGYSRSDSYSSVFGVSPSFGEKTLYQALRQGGGGEKALGRHAVAALLNSSTDDVSYDYSTAIVIQIVQDAYASGEFELAKNVLAHENERGCPLDRNDAVLDDRRSKRGGKEVTRRGGATRQQTGGSGTTDLQAN